MTIYVHFTDKTRTAVRLHNVAAVEDHGPLAVRVRITFSDLAPEFSGVSHVAVAPSTADDDSERGAR